MGTQQELDLLR